MGFISNISSEQKVDITFYSKGTSVINGIVQEEDWTEVITVKGLFWTNSQSLSLTSDKIKTNIEGSISVDYVLDIAGLDDSSRILVNNKYYRIVNIDNVGQQDEVLQILFKRERSN